VGWGRRARLAARSWHPHGCRAQLATRSWTITAAVNTDGAKTNGVIVAVGGVPSGIMLYL
jgi:arylsulfatase